LVEQDELELDMLILMDSSDSKLRFLPRFSVSALLIVVTVTCAWLSWDVYNRRIHYDYEQACDRELDRALLATHMKATNGTANSQAFFDYWANDLHSEANCQTNFLRLDGTFADGSAPDPYGRELLSEWLKNAAPAPGASSEHAERDSWFSSSFVDYKAIRAKANCVSCHNIRNAGIASSKGKPTPPLLQVDDLMAIGRVRLAK
jgi:hypothetical protein